MATLANWPDFVKFTTQQRARCARPCAAMCAAQERKQDSMAVSFFGGQDGAGARVWSAGKFVADQQDRKSCAPAFASSNRLCTDVLVAGVDIGLPQQLLNQLWAAVGHGELPHAFTWICRPRRRGRSKRPTPKQRRRANVLRGSRRRAAARREPMEIPDIPLTTNPLTSPRTTRDPNRRRPSSSRSASRRPCAWLTTIR